MALQSRLQILATEPEPTGVVQPLMSSPAPSQTSPTSDRGNPVVELLLLALRLLSTRTIVLANHLLPVVGISMAFYLWLQVLHEPSILQLVGLGAFGAFFLLLMLVRR